MSNDNYQNMNPDYNPNINPWVSDTVSDQSLPDNTVQITPVDQLDFLDAMRQNHRNTWILIFAMILLATLFGYLLGFGWDAATGRSLSAGMNYAVNGQVNWRHFFLTPSSTGIMAAISLAAGMTMWGMISLWRADKIVLSKTDAVDASEAEYAQLHNIVEEIAIAAGLPKPRIVIVPTDVPNAFATGLYTNNAIIGVTQGLLSRLNRREIQGVIAHEMGHILNGDMRYATIIAVMTGSLVFVAQMILNFRHAFTFGSRSSGRNRRGNAAGNVIMLIIFVAAAIIVPIIAKLIQMGISRQREYLADATAVQLTRDPGGLIGALEKISQDQYPAKELPQSLEPLYIMTPAKMLQNGHNAWLSTHPPLEKRIERLKALE